MRNPKWSLPAAREPATEAYLESITIGEHKPLNDRIQLAPYDANWPSMFSRAAQKVRSVLSDGALQIEHVGSTAVPGLSAKPIIDMVLAVEDPRDEASYVAPLESQDFVLRKREPDWFEHRLLILRESDLACNLHVFALHCEESERMIAFRDWLRVQDADRELYESTKKVLATQTWRHVQNYADAKSEIIRKILERARTGIPRNSP